MPAVAPTPATTLPAVPSGQDPALYRFLTSLKNVVEGIQSGSLTTGQAQTALTQATQALTAAENAQTTANNVGSSTTLSQIKAELTIINQALSTVNGQMAAANASAQAALQEVVAHGQTILSLNSQTGANAAAITQVAAAYTTANEALAGEITTLSAQVLTPGSNLVQNSTFANGVTGWTISNGAVASSGSNAAGAPINYLVWQNPAGLDTADYKVFGSQNFSCYASTPYAFQAWMYSDAVAASTTYVRTVLTFWTGANGTGSIVLNVAYLQSNVSAGWTLFKQDANHSGGNVAAGAIVSPSNAASVTVTLDAYSSSGNLDWGAANSSLAWGLVKLEAGTVCTPWSDNVTPQISASVTNEAVARAAGDSSLASQISTVQSDFNSLSSTVSTNATTAANATAAVASNVTILTAQANPNPNLLPWPLEQGFTHWTREIYEGTDQGGQSAYQDANWGQLAYCGMCSSTSGGQPGVFGYISDPFPCSPGNTYSISGNLQCLWVTNASPVTYSAANLAYAYAYMDLLWCDASGNILQYNNCQTNNVTTLALATTDGYAQTTTAQAPPGNVGGTAVATMRLRVVFTGEGNRWVAGWAQRLKVELGTVCTPYNQVAQVISQGSAIALATGQLYGSYTLQATAGNVVTGMQLLSASGPVSYSSIVFTSSDFYILPQTGVGSVQPFYYNTATGTLELQNCTVVGQLNVSSPQAGSGYMTMVNDLISIYDGNNVLRVQLGVF